MTSSSILNPIVFTFILGCAASVLGQTSSGEATSPESRLLGELAADPTREFGGARQTYLQVDLAETAVHLRRGLAAMREQARDTTDEGRQAIRDSVDELSHIASRLEERREVSSARLDAALARAQFALAHNHLVLANKARNEQAREKIGRELKAASDQVQYGVKHLGKDLRDEEAEIQNATKRLAKKLAEGGDATREEIHDGLIAFRDHMAKLRKRLWPEERTTTPEARD